MVTIRDVAKSAGVSVATVSRVLNNSVSSKQTRTAVLQAVESLGYSPNANAQALALKNTDTLGVVVTDVTDSFFSILVREIDQVADEYNKSILIGMGYHNAEKEKKAIDNLLRKRCSALVVHSKALDDQTLIQYLDNVPTMVIINRVIEGYEDRCITLNNQRGTFIATETLILQGHKKIAYIGTNHNITDETERKNGYIQALEKYHLSKFKNATITTSPDFEGGEKAMVELLSYHSDLTAVVAYNDNIAAGVLSVLNENNIKVPEQFSVIGFDDMPIAKYLIPKLTTIRYPINLMANYAARLALSLANKDIDAPSWTIFQPTLVKRFSTKKLS